MLQALHWDHIWDVRINLVSSDAQGLFQPVAFDDLHGNIGSPLHDVF